MKPNLVFDTSPKVLDFEKMYQNQNPNLFRNLENQI
jgi:hypothetical protein